VRDGNGEGTEKAKQTSFYVTTICPVFVPRLLQTSTGNVKLQKHYIPLMKDDVFDVNIHTPSLLATILKSTDN
jgi:hypothetical protein